MNNFKKNKGFVVLYASLVGGVVLAIGLAILTITVKQLGLSSAGRESHRAFYVADTAMECALYLNRLDREAISASWGTPCSGGIGIFADIVSGGALCEPPSSEPKFTCAGEDVIFEPVDSTGDGYISTFSLGQEGPDDEICADVTVTKYNTGATSFVSAGRNTCRDTQNKYERSIQIDF